MGSEWPQVSLREFADLLAGFAFKSSGYTEESGDIRLLRGDNIAPGKVRWDGVKRWTRDGLAELSRYSLEAGDVVLAMDRPWIPAGLKVAQVSAADTPSYLVQRVARLRTSSLEDQGFLFALLSTPDFESYIQSATTGTAVPHISAKQILNFSFRLPPSHVRAQIGALTSALDDRITLLRETNATLEAIAQALFKSWFVDFDPVHANIAAKNAPEGAVQGSASAAQGTTAGMPEAGQRRKPLPPMPAAALDAATAALFPDSFEESELGLVPKGWERLAFTETVKVIGGGTPKTSVLEYWDGDIPWFSVVDAPTITDVFVIDTAKHISLAGLNNSSTKLLPEGATIISARGTVGRLALVGKEMAMNQSCYGLEGKAGDAYFTYFSTYRLVESLKQRSHGSVFDTITTETMKGVTVIYPAEKAINAFEAALSPVMGRMKENLRQAQTLTQLRDTLLPRLISGQLRLPEAETLLETMP